MFISRRQLDAFAGHSGRGSVSMWVPSHSRGPATQEDPIRIKNLLARAQEQLVQTGVRPCAARDRLAEVSNLIGTKNFRWPRSDGLGVFLGNAAPIVLRLPVAPPEVVTVCDTYYIKPLLGTWRQDERFYLLELSQNVVRLLRASRYEVEPVELPKAPKDFAEFLQFDEFERHVEFHTGSAAHQPGRNRPAVYHGQGGGSDEAPEKRQLMDYCRRIDAEVVKVLQGERAPLLLAAAEPLQGVYRQVSSYPQLDTRRVAGNPDEARTEELHRQAVELLEDDFAQPIRAAADRYGQAEHLGLVEHDLEGILKAASAHAIDVLLVSAGEQCWGRFHPEQGRLERHDVQQAGDEDLLNLAAVLAYRGGAAVHAVEREKVPGNAPAAATLRFRPRPRGVAGSDAWPARPRLAPAIRRRRSGAGRGR